MSANPIDEAVVMLEALQERWCASTAGKPGARRIATFDAARGAQGEDDFDNEVSATRRCASDLALAIERIRALTAAQQQGQACECPIPMDDPPDMHAPGCVVRQPKQQGQAVAPYAYMQDCDLAGVTLLKAKGQSAVFSCLTWKTDEATIPLYTAPPTSVPEWVSSLRGEALGRLAQDEWMGNQADYPAWGFLSDDERAMWVAVGERIKSAMLAAAPSAQGVGGA